LASLSCASMAGTGPTCSLTPLCPVLCPAWFEMVELGPALCPVLCLVRPGHPGACAGHSGPRFRAPRLAGTGPIFVDPPRTLSCCPPRLRHGGVCPVPGPRPGGHGGAWACPVPGPVRNTEPIMPILVTIILFFGACSTQVVDRQELVDQFNGNTNIFAFLLSTRAGGQGLNLAGAFLTAYEAPIPSRSVPAALKWWIARSWWTSSTATRNIFAFLLSTPWGARASTSRALTLSFCTMSTSTRRWTARAEDRAAAASGRPNPSPSCGTCPPRCFLYYEYATFVFVRG